MFREGSEFGTKDPAMSNPDGVAHRCPLPDEGLAAAWSSIKLPDGVRERLLAQSLLSFTVRQKLPFESAPLHGLILLSGAPGTGKTTVARGLANQIAKQLPGTKCTFVEIDPHALASSALGRSQQAMTKLFDQTIPELAMGGAAIVLLDEVETLAVSRHKLSFDANPADVHRATDAVLSGMDRLTRQHRNVLLLATTNFATALDEAFLSRADHTEEFGLPNEEARREIIADTLKAIGGIWKSVRDLGSDAGRLAKAAHGLDGRRIRKDIFVAMGSDIDTAKDPNKLTRAKIEAAFRRSSKTQKEMAQ
jgi:AAA+ superfamily predicted ATPase